VNHFRYQKGRLFCEDVPLEDIAERVGTPTYVYSRATLERHHRVLTEAFRKRPTLLCYSVKANSNLAVLALFAKRGSGFDIVSGGELFRVLKAGGDPSKIVFSGVGKTAEEIDAALDAKVKTFNVESWSELNLIARRAQHKKVRAPVALRVKPDVDAKTHRHISTGHHESKFGVSISEAGYIYRGWKDNPALEWVGLDCHIGSQLTDMRPLREALDKLTRFFVELRNEGLPLRTLDVGGGLGIPYRPRGEEKIPSPTDWARTINEATRELKDVELVIEPGRVLVGNAGVLLTRQQLLKKIKDSGRKWFVVVDAGMNDLIRPALYEAYHEVLPVLEHRRSTRLTRMTVVGPVCESTDVLARDRLLLWNWTEKENEKGQLFAIMTAGAYGMVMASNYNSRRRPAEVLVSGSDFEVVRERETFDDLIRGERVASQERSRAKSR
jgi:diaminopimelate decarboxylase